MAHIETPEEIGLPLLGYLTITTVKGIEINEANLLSTLTEMGLSRYMPGLPLPTKTLGRAIRRWLKEVNKVDIGFGNDEKALVRTIVGRSESDVVVYGLVAEKKDLVEWGLEYLTNLRIFYEKENGALSLRCTGVGQDYARMTGNDLSMLSQLEPHWNYYKNLYVSSDLSRMITAMVKDLDSINAKDRSGVYFVPTNRLAELQQIQTLIEEKLPLSPGDTNKSNLSAFPQIDRAESRRRFGNLAYQSLLGDLSGLDAKLNRFVETASNGNGTGRGRPGLIKKESVLAQLGEYKDMKTKILLYKEKLGIQQEELLAKLSGLEETARKLIDIEVEV